MAYLYPGNYYTNINKGNTYNIIVPNANVYTSPQVKQQFINNPTTSPFLLKQQNIQNIQNIRLNSPIQYKINTIQINPTYNQNVYQTGTVALNYKEKRVPRYYYKPVQNIIIQKEYINNNPPLVKIQRANTANFAPRMTTVPRVRPNYYYNILNNTVQPAEVKVIQTNVRYNSLNQKNNEINNSINNVRIISNEQIINNEEQKNNPQMNEIQKIKEIKTVKSNKSKKVKKKLKKIPKVTKVTKLTDEKITEKNGQIVIEKTEEILPNNNLLTSPNEQVNNRNRFAYSAHFPNSIKLKNNMIDNNSNNVVTNNNQNNMQNESIKPFISLNGELLNNINCKEYYRQTDTAPVTSYGYSQNQNAPNRNYMEDEGRVVENFTGDPNKILFCIFDGHGGGQVSKYLQENFYKYMKNFYNYKNYNAAFVEIFRKVDEDIKLLNCPNVGSTATIVYIEKQKDNKKILYCANVGDSRCVLVSKNGVYRLSYDDRVKDPIENERINKNGGIIVNNRVYGQLMLSRSFGDWKIKDVGVIVDPHITRFELDDDSLFVVIASDGVWDVLKDEECSILEKMYVNTGEMCKKIIGECLKRKSLDNLSCFVISLK